MMTVPSPISRFPVPELKDLPDDEFFLMGRVPRK